MQFPIGKFGAAVLPLWEGGLPLWLRDCWLVCTETAAGLLLSSAVTGWSFAVLFRALSWLRVMPKRVEKKTDRLPLGSVPEPEAEEETNCTGSAREPLRKSSGNYIWLQDKPPPTFVSAFRLFCSRLASFTLSMSHSILIGYNYILYVGE